MLLDNHESISLFIKRQPTVFFFFRVHSMNKPTIQSISVHFLLGGIQRGVHFKRASAVHRDVWLLKEFQPCKGMLWKVVTRYISPRSCNLSRAIKAIACSKRWFNWRQKMFPLACCIFHRVLFQHEQKKCSGYLAPVNYNIYYGHWPSSSSFSTLLLAKTRQKSQFSLGQK